MIRFTSGWCLWPFITALKSCRAKPSIKALVWSGQVGMHSGWPLAWPNENRPFLLTIIPLSPTFSLKIRAFSTSPAMSIPWLICVVIRFSQKWRAGYGPNISAPLHVSGSAKALNSFSWLPAIARADLVTAYKAQLGINMWKNTSRKKHGPCHWSNCFYSGNELEVKHWDRHTYTVTQKHRQMQTQRHTRQT